MEHFEQVGEGEKDSNRGQYKTSQVVKYPIRW